MVHSSLENRLEIESVFGKSGVEVVTGKLDAGRLLFRIGLGKRITRFLERNWVDPHYFIDSGD
jgi:hypothetical protein